MSESEVQRRQAQRLLEAWERLSRTHMMAGGGCACGVGGVVVALADFEQDIADFIVAEAERQARQDVLDFLDANARNDDLWSIAALLGSISNPAIAPDSDVAAFALERLGRTLQSFEKLHGSG